MEEVRREGEWGECRREGEWRVSRGRVSGGSVEGGLRHYLVWESTAPIHMTVGGTRT